MKITRMLALLAVPIAFFACGDDESDFITRSDSEIEKSSSSENAGSSVENVSSSSVASLSSENLSSEASSNSEASSSSKESSSSVCEDVKANIPFKIYDCSVYDCVTTEFLNPDVEYGEFLDERDNKVYRTVQIGKQTWMAQNLNFVPEDGSVTRCAPDDDDCSVYGRYYDYRNKPKDNHLCPTGWDVPSDDQIDELNEYVIEKFSKDHPYEWEYELDRLYREKVALEELRAASCRWSSTDPRYDFYGSDHYRQWDGRWKNETGFSLLPAGYYDPWKNNTETGWRYVGCAAYLYASPSEKGARYFTGCTSILLSTLGDLYKSLRCIKEVTEAETDSIEVSVDSLAN